MCLYIDEFTSLLVALVEKLVTRICCITALDERCRGDGEGYNGKRA